MTINFIQRKSFKERAYKALSIFVGVITILNVSMVGALLVPTAAQATGGTTPYCPSGNPLYMWDRTPNTGWSHGQISGFYEGEDIPVQLELDGLTSGVTKTLRVEHQYIRNSVVGVERLEHVNAPIEPGLTFNSDRLPFSMSAPTTTGSNPSIKTYTLTFTPTGSTATLYFDALLGPHAHLYNGASLHVSLTDCGSKDVPIAVNQILYHDLQVAKSDNPDPINVGAYTTYTITAKNNGVTANGEANFTVTDTLPAQMTYVNGSASPAPTSVVGQVLTWNFGTVADGVMKTITFQATGTAAGTWRNNVSLASTGVTAVTDHEDTTVLGQCALTVTKKVNGSTGPVAANPGDTVTYRVDVSNDGTANCTGGGVKITDVVDTQLTYTGETHSTNVLPGYLGPSTAYNSSDRKISWNAQVLTPGQSAWVQWTATVQPSACGEFDIPNVANVYADQYNNMQTAIPSNTVHVTGTKNCTGTISGKKFNDLNGNGTKDAGEPGLSGWTIQLKNTSDVVLDSAVTDGSGNYTFTAAAPATYRLREVLQGGWVQTTTNPLDVALVIGQNVTSVNFGNFQKITLSGSKFNDQNNDGAWNAGEPGLSGWTIELDTSPFGSVDATTLTNGSGNYSFTNLGPGTYRLREVVQTGWSQTTVNPTDVSAVSGTNVTDLNFGNYRDTGTIKVNKKLDNDGNGSFESVNPGSFTWLLNGSGTRAMGSSATVATLDTHTINENYDANVYNLVGWSYGAPEQVDCAEPQYGELPASLTVTKDGTTEITICNVRKTGRLIVHKLLDQDGNPQTPPLEDPQGWTFDIQNGEQDIAMGDGRTLVTDTYTVNEDQHPNYTAGDWYCSNNTGVIASGSGEQLTVNLTTAGAECWFSNMRDTGSLKVSKLLDNDGNGSFETTNPGSFYWGLNAATPDRVMGSTLPGLLTATTYDVGENHVNGYHFVGWSYGAPEQVDCLEPQYGELPASISVTKGETTEITLCNARDMVEITFDKQIVDPSQGGPAGDGDFAFYIDSVAGTFYDGSTVMLPTNTFYDVAETSPYSDLYTLSGASGLCSRPDGIRLSVGEQSGTCVIVNTRKTGTVTVHKYFNDDADESWERIDPQTGWNWDLTPGHLDNLAGTTLTLGTGAYAVSEDAIENYTSSWNCSDQSFGVGTSIPFELGNGQDLVCTFYNVRQTGGLTVIKAVDTDGDGDVDYTNTGWTWDLDSGNQNFDMGTTQSVITGFHDVSEDQQANYHSTGWACVDSETQSTLGSGSETSLSVIVSTHGATCTFTNARDTGTIDGYKYNDLNGNGVWDNGEPGLDGWTIQLSNGASAVTGAGEWPLGYYRFTLVPTGTYSVNEVGQAGWTSTTQNPVSGVVVTYNQTTPVNFGNFQNIAVSGQKYNDLNGNGVWDNGEPGLQNWTIQLDTLPFGSVDASVATDVNGNYSFTNLGPGTYRFREVGQAGWTQTSADPADVTASSGTNVSDIDFGNFLNVSVRACKVADADGNLQTTGDQSAIPDWTVHLSMNGQTADTQVTGENGCYTWTNLRPGVSYDVSETVPTGWTALTPTSHDFGPATSGSEYSYTFANFELGRISGYKFNDLNGNGTWEQGEPALNDWRICLNGVENCVWTGSGEWPDGYYEFTGLTHGWYDVYEMQQFGWTQTTSNFEELEITSGANLTHRDFGNRLNEFGVDIEKDAPATVNAGSQMTFTLNWSVSGNIPVTDVMVTDPLPLNTSFVSAGCGTTTGACAIDSSTSTIKWSLGTRNAGESGTVTLTVAVAAPLTNGTVISNTGKLCGTGNIVQENSILSFLTDRLDIPSGTEKCDEDTTTTTVSSAPTLGLLKSADPTVVPAGSNVNWTVQWSISGNAHATNVVITDPIPANSTFVSVADGGVYDAVTNTVSWNLGTQLPGASGTVHYVTKTANPIANGTVITNTATIDSAETDPAISASAVATVTSAPDLTITKVSDLTTFTNPGKTVNYTVVVTNKSTATDTARNVVMTDTLPAGFTFAVDGASTKTFAVGNLAPGQSTTITFLVNISGTQAAGTYVNTAKAKGDNTAEVTATTPVEVRVPTVLTSTSPDLTIVKVVSKKNLKPGDVTTYTLTVTNNGDGDATNVIVIDTIPSGLSFVHIKGKTATWKLGTLKPGHSRVINVDVRVNTNAKKGTYENVATVTADDMPVRDAKASVNVTVPKVLGLATTGTRPLDFLIVLVGLMLIGLGIRGLRLSRKIVTT